MPDPISNKAIELNQKLVIAQPILPPTTAPTSLNTLLTGDGSIFTFSGSGATGALLVRQPGATSGGAAIKIETKEAANRVVKCAQMMDAFFQNAIGPAPFVAPRVTPVTKPDQEQHPKLLEDYKTRLEQRKGEIDDSRHQNIDKQKQRVDSLEEDGNVVFSMELGKGAQLGDLGSNVKVSLYKTENFARTLGRSAPVMMALGLNDHLGLGHDYPTFKNNSTNLMYDPEAGQLSVIDFETGMRMDQHGNVRYSEKGAQESMQEVNDFLAQSFENPEAFDAAVESMVNGEFTPFKRLMDTFTSDHDELGFHQDAELSDQHISREDKRRFAANLLVGAIDGMDYLKKNETALRTAVDSVKDKVMVEGNEVTIEHFYTASELDRFCDEVKKLDTGALMQKAESFSAGMPQRRMDQLAAKITDLNQQVAEVQQKIDKLGFFARRGSRKRELEETKAVLNQQLGELHKDLNGVINREEISKPMKAQWTAGRADKLQSLATELQLDTQALELRDRDNKINSPKELRSLASNKEINAQSFRETAGDEGVPESTAKLARLRADREDAHAKLLRTTADIMAKDTVNVSDEDLGKLRQDLLDFQTKENAVTLEQNLQKQQTRVMYTEAVKKACETTLKEQEFTDAEIDTFVEASVDLALEAESAVMRLDQETANAVAEQFNNGLKTNQVKFSDYNDQATKLHDALYKAYDVRVDVAPDQSVAFRRKFGGSFEGKVANRVLNEAALKHGLDMTPLKGPSVKSGVEQPKVEESGELRRSTRDDLHKPKVGEQPDKNESVGQKQEGGKVAKLREQFERMSQPKPPTGNPSVKV